MVGFFGELESERSMQEWRNWQTRRLQVPVVAISCGFKSHLLQITEKQLSKLLLFSL